MNLSKDKADATGPRPRQASGVPKHKPNSRNQRDSKRMFNNLDKRTAAEWGENTLVAERFEEIQSESHRKNVNRGGFDRRMKKKPAATPSIDPSEMLATKSTPAVDEQMWEIGPYSGTHPLVQQYSQNYDFSSWSLLLESVYAVLETQEPRLRRRMPFALFQHALTEYFWVYILDHLKKDNVDAEFVNDGPPTDILPEGMVIPEVISEYIRAVAINITATGDEVRVNIPQIARPRAPEDDIEAGSFGVCNAQTHNVYECYPSPLVSKKLIERTAEANRAPNAEGAFGNWSPLPNALIPEDAIATPNLLGYRKPERLAPEGIAKCEDLVFANDATIAGRIRDCPQVTALVSDTMSSLATKMKMTSLFPTPKPSASSFGIVEVREAVADTARLSNAAVSVKSPYAIGASTANKCATLGLKRRRMAESAGLCFLTANNAPFAGWNATRNSNLDMVAPFGPLIGRDRVSLREDLHEDNSPQGDRLLVMHGLIKRAFTVK